MNKSKSVIAVYIILCIIFTMSCSSINETTSTSAQEMLTVKYYAPGEFIQTFYSIEKIDPVCMYLDDYTNIQSQIWDPLISIQYYQYSDPSKAVNNVISDYNTFYQDTLDRYYDGSVYYSEGDNQACVLFDLMPTNPDRPHIVGDDAGLYFHYGISCYNNDMYVSIYTLDETDEARERVDEILNGLGFPTPQSIPDDIDISNDFEPLPYITSETTETEYVSDYEIYPIDTNLSFDEVMIRWNDLIGIDMSHYSQDLDWDANSFEYNEHTAFYVPNYQLYADIYLLSPDECGIVWYEFSDAEYNITRELDIDGFEIYEYTNQEWAEQAYREITDYISLEGIETSDSNLVNGYCYTRKEYNNGSTGFAVYYYFGNCVLKYQYNSQTDLKTDYTQYLNMCEVLDLPVSQQLSDEILEVD